MSKPPILSIFDLDGVLIDLCETHRAALRTALEAHGRRITPEQERSLEGLPTRVKLERLGIPKELHSPINRAKQLATLHEIKNGFGPNGNVINAVFEAKLRGHVAVYSNSVRETIAEALKVLGIKHLIDLVISAEDVQFCKPHPEGYLTAMKKLGYLPQDTMIFEDSECGITAAKKSGAFVTITDVNTLDGEFVRWALDEAVEC